MKTKCLFFFPVFLVLLSIAYNSTAQENMTQGVDNDIKSTGLVSHQGPRVMVIIYSTEIVRAILPVALEGNRNAENQIENALLEKGFQVVDAGQISRRKELEALLMREDPALAGKMARDFGADILVQGEVRRTFVDQRRIFGRPTSFFSNEIRIKAFETDTSEIIFSGYETRPPSGAGALLPLENATAELCEKMTEAILEQQKNDISQASIYELNISRVSFSALSNLVQALKGIQGLDQVEIRSFQEGHAVLDVKYRGTAKELAEKISRIKNPSLEITGFQSRSIDIRLR